MWFSFMHKNKLLWQAEEEKPPEFLLHTDIPLPPLKIAMAACLVVPYTALIYPVTLRHFHFPSEKFSHKRVLQWWLLVC